MVPAKYIMVISSDLRISEFHREQLFHQKIALLRLFYYHVLILLINTVCRFENILITVVKKNNNLLGLAVWPRYPEELSKLMLKT